MHPNRQTESQKMSNERMQKKRRWEKKDKRERKRSRRIIHIQEPAQ